MFGHAIHHSLHQSVPLCWSMYSVLLPVSLLILDHWLRFARRCRPGDKAFVLKTVKSPIFFRQLGPIQSLVFNLVWPNSFFSRGMVQSLLFQLALVQSLVVESVRSNFSSSAQSRPISYFQIHLGPTESQLSRF